LTRNTHTFVTLTVPSEVYMAIRQLLLDAGYTHALLDYGKETSERIDMHGIALRMEREEKKNAPANGNTNA
jgi:hypothetical protein